MRTNTYYRCSPDRRHHAHLPWFDTHPALSLLDTVPHANINLDRLPEERQRRLYDAFHLELRYNDLTSELDLRVTITGETATELGATVQAILEAPETGDAAPGPR